MSWFSLIKVGADAGINNGIQQHDKDAESQKWRERDTKMTYAEPDQQWQGSGTKASENIGQFVHPGLGAVDKNIGNAPTAVGGYAAQPTSVNSSRPILNQFAADSSTPAQTSGGLRDYLNYAKYGRRQ